MGNRGATQAGMKQAPITVDQSVCVSRFADSSGHHSILTFLAGMIKVIDAASRDKESGIHMR